MEPLRRNRDFVLRVTMLVRADSLIYSSPLLDSLIRAPVRHVLDIGAGSGVTGDVRSWRFAHEFLEGPLERTARCRLDARPQRALATRVTLYFGKASEEHYEERIGPGHLLWHLGVKTTRARS